MFPTPTIAQAAQQIRHGHLSPLDLVEQCLAQIDKYDSQIRAWVLVDAAGARRTAAALSRDPIRGPLHGIPVGIKDIIDVEGLPTRAGSTLTQTHPADADAPLVRALRRAGAIILGKTVTVEFACFDPSPTRNPWDPALQHTPGGSSSGSAAALATGMCLGALGTQTGGSLIRPATYCGVAALKPSFGLLSTQGITPVSYHLDHPGPMARTAADLRILLEALIPSDQTHSPTPKRTPDPTAPPRLGVLEPFIEQAAEPVRHAVTSTVDRLRLAGATVLPVSLPDSFSQVMPMHRRIMASEAAAYHRDRFAAHRDSYGPLIRGLLDEGLQLPAVDYASALAWQRQFRHTVQAMLQDVDVLLLPSTDTTAPPTLETTGPAKFQAPWSCAGVPALTIPCALGNDGMPVGLQLVARLGCEADLLTAAAWCESAIAFHHDPPLLNSLKTNSAD